MKKSIGTAEIHSRKEANIKAMNAVVGKKVETTYPFIPQIEVVLDQKAAEKVLSSPNELVQSKNSVSRMCVFSF